MLIPDGDVAGVIATTDPDTGVDIYMGSGGAPEGVLAAAALRCVGGQIQGRLLFRNDDERGRARRWGIEDLDRVYKLEDMASGDCIFAATGVTDGSLLDGVKRRSDGTITTESIVMRASSGTVRRIGRASQATTLDGKRAATDRGRDRARASTDRSAASRGAGAATAATASGVDLVDQLLLARGVDARRPCPPPQPDPARFPARPVARSPDMDKAARRLADAVEAGETITIFGDYDVDGATSAALLTLAAAPARRSSRWSISPTG